MGLDGTQTLSDFSFGLAPDLGQNAEIYVSPAVGLALVVGGVAAISPVTEEEPLVYSINVSGR